MDNNPQTVAGITQARQMIIQSEWLAFIGTQCFIKRKAKKKAVVQHGDFGFFTRHQLTI